MKNHHPKLHDPIFDLISQEKQAQRDELRMIPSENYASRAVHKAMGSVLSHKYAEGYPKARYYQGNAAVDGVEELARERALALFGLAASEWGVNVQAYSGSVANVAIYDALLQPGDTIMAMYLPDGGHLSHGWQTPTFATHVARTYQISYYHVDTKTQVFDYDQIAKQAAEVKPKLLIAGGTAYPRDIDHDRMGEIAHQVGAYYLADISHESGLVATGLINSPFVAADAVMTTTHKTLRGPRGAIIFSRTQSPFDASLNIAKKIDQSIFPGLQGGPHEHTIAGIAVMLLEAQQPEYARYCARIIENTKALAEELTRLGHQLVAGGGDKHLLLVDYTHTDTEPWLTAWALEAAAIILNRNTVPGETASPFYPSGLRLGTPILTTRGMGVAEMAQVATWYHQVVEYATKWQLPKDRLERRAFVKQFPSTVASDKFLKQVRKEVVGFARQWPTFAW